jgi:hypothetical protein
MSLSRKRRLDIDNDGMLDIDPIVEGAPALQDAVAGQIDLLIMDPTTSLTQVRAGNVKSFAVAAAARLSSAPDIPTVEEAAARVLTRGGGFSGVTGGRDRRCGVAAGFCDVAALWSEVFMVPSPRVVVAQITTPLHAPRAQSCLRTWRRD